jgi:hypothetical protein
MMGVAPASDLETVAASPQWHQKVPTIALDWRACSNCSVASAATTHIDEHKLRPMSRISFAPIGLQHCRHEWPCELEECSIPDSV